mgnify:FL=1
MHFDFLLMNSLNTSLLRHLNHLHPSINRRLDPTVYHSDLILSFSKPPPEATMTILLNNAARVNSIINLRVLPGHLLGWRHRISQPHPFGVHIRRFELTRFFRSCCVSVLEYLMSVLESGCSVQATLNLRRSFGPGDSQIALLH